MKLFTIQCEDCDHIWNDFHKSYLCPMCHSSKTKLLDAPAESRDGIFTEGGRSNTILILWLGFMLAMVAAVQVLANGVLLK